MPPPDINQPIDPNEPLLNEPFVAKLPLLNHQAFIDQFQGQAHYFTCAIYLRAE
jgi:hypothetical protein